MHSGVAKARHCAAGTRLGTSQTARNARLHQSQSRLRSWFPLAPCELLIRVPALLTDAAGTLRTKGRPGSGGGSGATQARHSAYLTSNNASDGQRSPWHISVPTAERLGTQPLDFLSWPCIPKLVVRLVRVNRPGQYIASVHTTTSSRQDGKSCPGL